MKNIKKLFIILAILFIFSPNAFSENETLLQGSVSYTVDSARELAFEGLDMKLDKELLKPYLEDENNKENRLAIKNGTQIEGRTIMSFVMAKGLIKGYALVYDDKPEYVYYYSNGGYLIAVDANQKYNEDVYPYKVGKYSAVTGNLVSIGFYVSDDEQYVYSKNGKLKAHWVGNIGYNENGRPIATRDYNDEIIKKESTDKKPQKTN